MKHQNDNGLVDERRESVKTRTCVLADLFKEMGDTLPAQGGMDERQTASLKQWFSKHEGELRAFDPGPSEDVAGDADAKKAQAKK